MSPRFFSVSVFVTSVFVLCLVHVRYVQGQENDQNCSAVSDGPPTHYFGHYTIAPFTVACRELCTLSMPPDLIQLAELKVAFTPNDTTNVNCSWIIPGVQNNSLSTVMLFDAATADSLVYDVVCGETSPTLSVHDSSSVGGNLTNPYTICRQRDKVADVHIRRSTRLGDVDTVITLKGYDVKPGKDLVLLTFVTVDWSKDCSDNYREIVVDTSENTTAPGSQWFTSNLRYPNGLHCKWVLNNPYINDLTRLRVMVSARTTIPGSCVGDDYLLIKDDHQYQNPLRLTLCDDSTFIFFSTVSQLVYIDFYSGAYSGAPKFTFSYSTQEVCPQQSQFILAEDKENALYLVSDGAQQGQSGCKWKVHTNWTNDVVMLTRLNRGQFQQQCQDTDYLHLQLGSVDQRVSLCEDLPGPLWTDGLDMDVQLLYSGSSRRQAVLYHKTVRKVEACQGIPQRLEAGLKRIDVLRELTDHQRFQDDTAPDCRWLIVPSSQVTNKENYKAKVFISDNSPRSSPNDNDPSAWLKSVFHAYSSTSVSTNASLPVYCSYVQYVVVCEFTSTSNSLLLVYDPTLSTSPRTLDRLNIGFIEIEKDTSGQTGNALRSWHAQLLWALIAVVLVVVM